MKKKKGGFQFFVNQAQTNMYVFAFGEDKQQEGAGL